VSSVILTGNGIQDHIPTNHSLECNPGRGLLKGNALTEIDRHWGPRFIVELNGQGVHSLMCD